MNHISACFLDYFVMINILFRPVKGTTRSRATLICRYAHTDSVHNSFYSEQMVQKNTTAGIECAQCCRAWSHETHVTKYRYLKTTFCLSSLFYIAFSIKMNSQSQSVSQLKRVEAVSAPSSTAFAMGGNASYGVPFHFNNSSEFEPAHCYEAVSAPPSTAPASVSQSTSTPPPPIQHPSPANDNNENSTIPNSSKCDNVGRNSRAPIVLFVLLLALLLAMVTACVAFAVEVSRLKSEIASFSGADRNPQELQDRIQQLNNSINQQAVQFHSTLENTTYQLTSTIDMVSQNFTTLNTGLQQLMAVLVTRGQYAFPFDSCAALPPSSPSGHYWVRTPTGSAVVVYCDPTRSCGGVTGGWRRMAELDMTNSSQQCPSALRQRNDNNIRTCGTDPNRECSSLMFPTDSLSYSKVCGKVRAYQVQTTDSFGDGFVIGRRISNDIDTNYLDGVSLTHGFPRQHIWSFAAALDEVGTDPSGNCPCINRNQASLATRPPAFVGNDYFCDTGSSGTFDRQTFYSDDPLWDGAGCGPLNDCCSFNNPPWFYKQLPQPTTDSIEMRLCRDQSIDDEDIAIESVEIYVQ